jgi:hypothetical protein
MDPLLLNKFKHWYRSLYRSERYLFIICSAVICIMVVFWITRDIGIKKHNSKPIILGVSNGIKP